MSTEKSEKPNKESSVSPENITITIQFYSTMRNVTGTAQIERQVPKKTLIQNILIAVEKEFFIPKNAHILKSDQSDIEASVICLVDDADVHLTGGIKQALKHNCKIVLISSLHGG